LGIGGYHMIIASEHNFGPGQANTTLTAKWVAALEKEDDEQTADDETLKKCHISRKGALGEHKERAAGPEDRSIDEIADDVGVHAPSEFPPMAPKQ